VIGTHAGTIEAGKAVMAKLVGESTDPVPNNDTKKDRNFILGKEGRSKRSCRARGKKRFSFFVFHFFYI
jgi:hypothetical protein